MTAFEIPKGYKEIKPLIRKKHTVYDLYCPNCKSFVWGNNSLAYPYTCYCGRWKFDMDINNWVFKK